jgi:hypothetical protein
MNLPDWTDGKRLFEWTLAQLRPKQGPHQPRKGPSPYQYMIDVLKACERNDEEAFVKAMKDPRAARFAFSLIGVDDATRGRTLKPKRTDYVAFGSTLVTAINDLWDEHYGKHQRRRDNPPHATEIAAHLIRDNGWRITAEQIRRHREKHGAP